MVNNVAHINHNVWCTLSLSLSLFMVPCTFPLLPIALLKHFSLIDFFHILILRSNRK